MLPTRGSEKWRRTCRCLPESLSIADTPITCHHIARRTLNQACQTQWLLVPQAYSITRISRVFLAGYNAKGTTHEWKIIRAVPNERKKCQEP